MIINDYLSFILVLVSYLLLFRFEVYENIHHDVSLVLYTRDTTAEDHAKVRLF